MIIEPRIRNNICLTAHPLGCAAEVERQIKHVQSLKGLAKGPRTALIIGSSSGYGLASRITAAFGYQAATLGVAFEKAGTASRPGSAGYYNDHAFVKAAQKAGLRAASINGDAFSSQIKDQCVDRLKSWGEKVDLIVYSLASPARTDPADGVTYKSSLKPLDKPVTVKSLNFMTGKLTESTIEPAGEEELRSTIKVMGGEDWELWINALKQADLLAPGVLTVAYSYIGPKITHFIYRNGTIGKAKEDLEARATKLNRILAPVNGQALVSVNKALVTKAAAVIPVISLYVSLLFKVMKEKNIHEGCVEQAGRLFKDRLYVDGKIPVDKDGLIRLDDWEMRQDVQEEILRLWDQVNEDNLAKLADVEGFKQDFFNMQGFGVAGVDYQKDVET